MLSKLRRQLYKTASMLGDLQSFLTLNPFKIITRLLRKEVQKKSNNINKRIR